MPNFLFVRDEASGDSSRQTFLVDAPTDADFDAVAVGMLNIIRLSDRQVLGRDGRWLPLVQGIQVRPDPDETDGRPMHAHPGDGN